MDRNLTSARVIFKPDSKFSVYSRKWQGCPTVCKTRKGTMYFGWFSGGPREPDLENYCIHARSFDNGNTIEEPYMVIDSVPEEMVRAEDIQLWMDPGGKLWVFWTQTKVLGLENPMDSFDGVFGVWAITTEDPDDENPVWSQPVRLCDGFLRCRPSVLSNGTWIFPAYDWVQEDHRYTYYLTKDRGKTFEKCLGPKKPARNIKMFDETMIVEVKDGTLWLLVRTFEGVGRSISEDGGLSWSEVENPAFEGPCSRFFIGRLKSGNILFINHYGFTGRSHLTALLSDNEGKSFDNRLLLDERADVSYPDAIEDDDGYITVIYDRERHGAKEILTASFTEEDIRKGAFQSPDSYSKRIISKVD